MESLVIEKSELTPRVDFNLINRHLLIEGRCIPEAAHAFFTPLINWITDLMAQPDFYKNQQFILNIKCDYYNSASAKMFIYFFDKITEMQKNSQNITVLWHCENDDPDLIEAINDYMAITGVNITIRTD